MTKAILSHVRFVDQKPWTLIILIVAEWEGVKQRMLSLTYRHCVDHVTSNMEIRNNTEIF